MNSLILDPVALLGFFVLIILPIIAFVSNGYDYQNEQKKRENKYHNLSKAEREDLKRC